MRNRITTICLPEELHARVDAVARESERSRSYVVRKLLEQSLTGADRLTALQAIADQGLAEYDQSHSRERGPNPGEVIAASAEDGHARLRALNKIAKAGK